MLRRAGVALTGGGIAAGAYGYKWVNDNLGADAVARMIRYDKVALPAIFEYKMCEARCEKLPKMVPMLFSEVSEDEQLRRYQVLHKKYAHPLYDVFMELGGVAARPHPHTDQRYICSVAAWPATLQRG
jgi:hypothetical protein